MSDKEKLDLIYKKLKKIDRDCLNVTNSANISDEEYFKNGIYLDLVTNLIAIYLNDMTFGTGSLGINLNCRLILESIYIIKMYEKGKLGPLNFELYRNGYIMIEYSNERKFYNDAEKIGFINLDNNSINRAKFIKEWSKKLNMSEKELTKYSRDSSFFLLTKDKPNYLVKKYLGKGFYSYYKFLGMLIHPCIFEDYAYEQFGKLRSEIITEIYEFGLNFLFERKQVEYSNIPSFEEDSKNKITLDRANYTKITSNILSVLSYKTSHYKKGIDNFAFRSIGELICLWRDTELCRSYGYNEQSVIKLKIFLEYMSMFVIINNAETEIDFKNLVHAYLVTSTSQCMEFVKDEKFPNLEKQIEIIFNDYYKNKYKNLNFECFSRNIKNNSLFFINGCKEEKSYRNLVNDALSVLYKSNHNRLEELRDFYNISLDTSHSSGYLFNSCNYVWSILSRDISFEMIKFFKMYFEMCKIKFKKENLKDEIYPEDEMNKFNSIFEAAKYDFENPSGCVNIYAEQKK